MRDPQRNLRATNLFHSYQVVALQAHNLKVTGSNPVLATRVFNLINILWRRTDQRRSASLLCKRCVSTVHR